MKTKSLRASQLIISIVLLAASVLALLYEGTMSFRIPFCCVSFLLAAVAFCGFLDDSGQH